MLISLGDIAECDSKKFILLLDKFKVRNYLLFPKQVLAEYPNVIVVNMIN